MDNRPVAGVDVSKYFSDMCVLSPNNEIIGELHFAHDFEGMTKAKAVLESAEKKHGVRPVVVMESTSHYHRLLFYFLTSNGFDAIVINPLQSHAMKNINIRKVKSDRADAYRIALLYRLKKLRLTNAPIDTLFDIRNLTRRHSDLIKTRTMYSNRITADIDQIFPSFHKAFSSISSPTTLAMLENIRRRKRY
ncbi:MAG: IS110 family transposase [Clostridiales bacterium]|nr:IS110 family transposase [Clostridiales bacterium]